MAVGEFSPATVATMLSEEMREAVVNTAGLAVGEAGPPPSAGLAVGEAGRPPCLVSSPTCHTNPFFPALKNAISLLHSQH